MSVARAKREIDSVEFADWMAYYSIEPWGERIADVRMGVMASTMANVYRDPQSAPLRPADFIPWAAEPVQPLVFADRRDQAVFVALAVFGVDITKTRGRGKTFTLKRGGHG
ncbi:hypothetical protein QS306_14635 [Paraburkholderia bonniea]|uniref:phage tail assembly protein T n=1 Tax=Paraburkholderia bonniea TaxID=2152891 RepID=UPI001290AAAF|nr:hypothetical protein [Paraburkholderia bonniea]WJF92002.1 hypothetical protein QS306_14635 [Paraburkholderia bonniea]WJF95321.1 hypothetical protein QS308_14640 [Paraburkholderia bonniea]